MQQLQKTTLTSLLAHYEPLVIAGLVFVAHLVLRAADRILVGAFNDDGAYEKDRKSTRLNSSHANTSYPVFSLKQKTSSTSVPPRPPARSSARGAHASARTRASS